MFRGKIRMQTCRIILFTSLVWFLLDVAVIFYFSDPSTSRADLIGDPEAQQQAKRHIFASNNLQSTTRKPVVDDILDTDDLAEEVCSHSHFLTLKLKCGNFQLIVVNCELEGTFIIFDIFPYPYNLLGCYYYLLIYQLL